MIKISAVSYLNTKPFIYGLLTSPIAELIDLQLDIPSECARKLADGEVDLALAPVAIIPSLATPNLISDYCIGSTGAVKTVCVFSEKPLEEIKTLYLDFHSRTSVELTKILCREHWKITPKFVAATKGFETKIKGTTAALIIGDRAINHLGKHDFCYDLAEEWTIFTGLHFVFAAWVSNKTLPEDFLEKFNAALHSGIQHIPELTKIIPKMEDFDLEDYYRHCISYELNGKKRQGLEMFLGMMKKSTTFVNTKILIHE
jgi:chorismate dehydratase